ncbi:HlyIII-domain-containing protein [Serendipita vermifera]|nr:HlyIII-domain-containing protein [Serendipita vermifera]
MSKRQNVPQRSSHTTNGPKERKGEVKHQVRRLTFSWNEIPSWQRDNEYILTGYRGELGSWKRCLKSAFTYLHNETVNIQSHWIGGVIFLCVWLAHLSQIYETHSETMNGIDITFMTFFMIGAMTCLFLSGSYHMMCSHSSPIHDIFHRLDYSGIVILTVGSFYPAVYYGFYCDEWIATFWLVLLTISGGAAAYMVLSPTYSTAAYRRTRAYLFIALGLGGALPVIHLLIVDGYEHLRQLGIHWLLASAALYIGGALIYSERFPERIWPGRFDIFGSSHQIFHINVVLAALCHYMAMMRSIELRHGAHGGQCL